MSDDENELEKLRMAALQTLKKAAEKPAADVGKQALRLSGTAPYSHPTSIWRKFPSQGRGITRNGQFNVRKIVNSNLISIPTMETHSNKDSSKPINYVKQIKLRLDLPQNRYCNKAIDGADSEDSKKESSKFSRYDDRSDSDSENSETEPSESEEKLLRSNSLEALVQELEFEISGEMPEKTANKKAKVKKSNQADCDTLDNDSDRKLSDIESDMDKADEKVDDAVDLFDDCLEDKIEDDVERQAETKETKKEDDSQEEDAVAAEQNTKNSNCKLNDNDRLSWGSPKTQKSPQRGLLPKPRGFNPRYDHMRQTGGGNMFNDGPGHPKNAGFRHYQSQSYTAVPPPHPHTSYPPPPPAAPHYYNSHNAHSPAIVRPLSPLKLNPDAMNTITMAPLSPRSAAFVLQNREIIAKRKRSPRHSYSRSPSPRVRRSKSPRRRSPSPRRYARSTSPKRLSPSRRLRSPIKRRTRSPIERNSPKRDIKDRLVLNSNKRIERPERPERLVLSPENAAKIRRENPPERPKPQEKSTTSNKEDKEKDKERDPILEARRRKFEQQNTVNKEGIIRLKHTDDNSRAQPEAKRREEDETTHTPEQEKDSSSNEEEENVLDVDTLETQIDGLFSDEESEDENEGRFKSSNRTRGNASVLNFTSLNKLADIQNKSLENSCNRDNRINNRDRSRRGLDTRRSDRGRDRNRNREVRKHRSPLPAADRKERVEKKDDRKELRRDEDALRRIRGVERKEDRKEERKPSIKTRITSRREDKDDKDDRNDKNEKNEKASVAEIIAEKKTERSERSERNDLKTKEVKLNTDTRLVVAEGKTSRLKERPVTARKVAIAVDVKENKEFKPKDDVTVIDDDDEQDVIKKNEAGDLRAQLSRKRAERQNQKPTVNAEDVQSRLLHNALGAVFQKSKKSKRSDAEAAPKEKLPIHKRLGLNEEPAIKKKKSKRSTGEQV